MTAGIRATASLRCDIQIGASPSALDIAQATLNGLASQYDQPGTIGAKINAAGGAADPLANSLDGYADGTAGAKIRSLPGIGKLLALLGK